MEKFDVYFFDKSKKARAIQALRDTERQLIEKEENVSYEEKLKRLTKVYTNSEILEEYKKLFGKYEILPLPEPIKEIPKKKIRKTKKLGKKAKKLGKKRK